MKTFEIVLRFDEFALKTFVHGIPGHTLLDDAAFDDFYVGLGLLGLRPPRDWLWSVLRSYARLKRHHPLRDKLEELQAIWDGQPRIDTWLVDYCGVIDSKYARAVGAKWLIAAVRRVRDPGCKFDHVLIFEGPQGIGKSTVFRVLGYEQWFTDSLSVGLDAKEVLELTGGKWICELAELTNLAKRDVESVKHFVTRQIDEARMAYAREVLLVPRQFVLSATTNRTRYLRDETGDRRFWMVETKGVVDSGQHDLPMMLNAPGLFAIRDQLWAEAAVREAQGEVIHLAPDIEAMARAEQVKRFDIDERQQLLEDLLKGKSGFAPNDEIYASIGAREIRDRTPAASRLVSSAMARIGWTRHRMRVSTSSDQVRGWLSPDKGEMVLAYNSLSGFEPVERHQYRKDRPDI